MEDLEFRVQQLERLVFGENPPQSCDLGSEIEILEKNFQKQFFYILPFAFRP